MDKDYYHLMLDNLRILPATQTIVKPATRLWDIRKEYYDIVSKYPDIKETYLGHIIESDIARTSNIYKSARRETMLILIKPNIILDWISVSWHQDWDPPTKCNEIVMSLSPLNLSKGLLPSIIINTLLDIYQIDNLIDLLVKSRGRDNNAIIAGIISNLLSTTNYYGVFLHDDYTPIIRNQKIHRFNLIDSTIDIDNTKLKVVLQSTNDKRTIIDTDEHYDWRWKLFFGEQHLEDWKKTREQCEKNRLFSEIRYSSRAIDNYREHIKLLERNKRSLKKKLQNQRTKIYSNVELL